MKIIKTFFIIQVLAVTLVLAAYSEKATDEMPNTISGKIYSGVTMDPSKYPDESFSGEQVKPLIPNSPRGQVKPLPIEEPKVKKVISAGVAKIFGGNVENARMAALRMAYADAVASGCGTEIGSLTLIRNVKYISDIVTSRSRGFIKEYSIFREGISDKDPTKYEVVIEAIVISEGRDTDEDIEALKAYLDLLGKPKLLLILPEKRLSTISGDGMNYLDKEKEKTNVEFEKGDTKLKIIQEKTKNTQQSGANNPPFAEDKGETFRSTEAALAQAFSQYGYQVVTSDDLLAQGLCSPEVLSQAKAGVTARAIEVSKAAGADLAFLGVLNVTLEIVKPAGVDMVAVTGEANAKALLVSSGNLIEAYHRTERATHPQMLKAYADCLDKVANNIVSVLAWKIPQILCNEYRETKVTISGVTLSQTMDLKNALSKIGGVETVRISQVPTEKNSMAIFTLSSGFVFVEPLEILDICSKTIHWPFKLISANKYEIECAVGYQ